MEKINILEIGNYYSVPLLGKFLSNLGCNVSYITCPDNKNIYEKKRIGDCYNILREGKSSIKKEDVDNDFLGNIDFIITNLKYETLSHMKLNFENVTLINHNINFLCIPAFMKNEKYDNIYKHYESIVLASAGVFSNMGLNRTLLGIKSSYTTLPLASIYSSFFSLMAIVKTIYEEKRGEYITVPMASCLAEAMVHNSIHFDKNECYMNLRSIKIKKKEYPISEDCLEQLFDSFFSLYKCKDGRYFYLVCPSHEKHQRNALKLLDIDVSCLKSYVWDSNINGLGAGSLSEEQNKFLKPIMKAKFLEKTSFEWEYLFGINGVPGSAARSMKEWMELSHTHDSGLIENNRLCNFGWFHDTESIDNTKFKNNKKMSDIKVVDLTNVIAGPTIGTMLARFGAQVIKIDPVNPTYSPDICVFYGLATNMGKKSVLLDIYKTNGYKILCEILKDSDVLLVNCTCDCLERMKLTRQHLKNINPNLVLCQFDAWSGPHKNKGFMSNYNGYDDCIQSSIGIMERFGGGDFEEHAHVGTIDVIAGVAGACAAIVGLIHRKNGFLSTPRTSLAAVGQYLQMPHMYGKEFDSLGLGKTCVGESIFHSCYETMDGFILVVFPFYNSTEENYKLLKKLFGFKNKIISFKKLNSEHVCNLLNRNCVSAIELITLENLREENSVEKFNANSKTFQYIETHKHPIGSLTLVGPISIRMKGIDTLGYSAKYGKHTIEILNKYGFENYRVASVASTLWSRSYIPYISPCESCRKNSKKKFILCCGHKLCIECTKFSDSKCPICKIEHELVLIKDTIKSMRENYQQWRLGNSKGAKLLEYYYKPNFKKVQRSYSWPTTIKLYTKPSSVLDFRKLS